MKLTSMQVRVLRFIHNHFPTPYLGNTEEVVPRSAFQPPTEDAIASGGGVTKDDLATALAFFTAHGLVEKLYRWGTSEFAQVMLSAGNIVRMPVTVASLPDADPTDERYGVYCYQATPRGLEVLKEIPVSEHDEQFVDLMPFRPYKRFVSESFSITEYHDHIQRQVIQAGAEDQELEAVGGRRAVLVSIRRHLPSFDAAEAQTVCGPAWLQLKPILVRCGLNPVYETTTLTDIKAFLDAATPQKHPGEVGMPDQTTVFVVHGRNEPARKAMFDFLRALALHPLEWDQAVQLTGKGAPYVGEILDAAFSKAQAVVVIMTGDDLAYLRPEFQQNHDPAWEKEPTVQARPNVLFEAGMALGRHPERTIIVQLGPVRPFSDTAGRHVVFFDGSAEHRTRVRDRLKSAGCAVSEAGTDWLSAGDFGEAVQLASAPKSKRSRRT